jgi:hypothetical protein
MVLWRSMARLHRRFDEAGLAALLSSSGFEEARAWPVLDGYGLMAMGRAGPARPHAAVDPAAPGAAAR